MDVGHRPVGAAFRNQILTALRPDALGLLLPHLSHVTLVSGQILHEPGSLIDDVFFMEDGVTSLTGGHYGQWLRRSWSGWAGRFGRPGASEPGGCGGDRAPGFCSSPWRGVSHADGRSPRSRRAVPFRPRPLPALRAFYAGVDPAMDGLQCSPRTGRATGPLAPADPRPGGWGRGADYPGVPVNDAGVPPGRG